MNEREGGREDLKSKIAGLESARKISMDDNNLPYGDSSNSARGLAMGMAVLSRDVYVSPDDRRLIARVGRGHEVLVCFNRKRAVVRADAPWKARSCGVISRLGAIDIFLRTHPYIETSSAGMDEAGFDPKDFIVDDYHRFRAS